MRVLVTGGTGLVGSAIRKLVVDDTDNEWTFLSSSTDLRVLAQARAAFERTSPTHVIHLAARVGGLYDNIAHNVEFYRDNALINDNVLSLAHEFGVEKVVSTLSTCIFPDAIANGALDAEQTVVAARGEHNSGAGARVTQCTCVGAGAGADVRVTQCTCASGKIINEYDIHRGPPHASNEGYAYAKRMLEVQSRLYRRQYKRNFVTVVPTNVFGPNDNFDLERAHVIPALVHKAYIASRLLDGTEDRARRLQVRGDGSDLRQFMYSRDLARLYLWVLRNYDEELPLILSVGTHDEVTIGSVAGMIAAASGLDGVEFAPEEMRGQRRKCADNARLMRALAASGESFEFTPLTTAIGETVAWFRENYTTARK